MCLSPVVFSESHQPVATKNEANMILIGDSIEKQSGSRNVPDKTGAKELSLFD